MANTNSACFAINDKGECKALDTEKRHGKKCLLCVGYDTCAFYRSAYGHHMSCDAANARLRSLSEIKQRCIADKYFGGYRPWATE